MTDASLMVIMMLVIIRLRRQQPQNPLIRMLKRWRWPIIIGLFGYVLAIQVRYPFSTLHLIVGLAILVNIVLIIRAKPDD